MNKNILFLKLRSNAPHRLLSTQPPCCARQPNDVISVLAGPLKRRLAALICIVHPTGLQEVIYRLPSSVGILGDLSDPQGHSPVGDLS